MSGNEDTEDNERDPQPSSNVQSNSGDTVSPDNPDDNKESETMMQDGSDETEDSASPKMLQKLPPTGEGYHGGLDGFLYPEGRDLRRAKAKLSQRPRWANGVVGNVLNGTLFSNTITQLCIVIKKFDEIDLGVSLIVLIAFSICLQIATGFILVYMTVNQSHYKHPKRVRSLPKVCALLVFSLFLVNIAIDCFYLQMTNKS